MKKIHTILVACLMVCGQILAQNQGSFTCVNDTLNDLSVNNTQLWNNINLWDNTVGSHNLAESAQKVAFRLNSPCASAAIVPTFLLDLDIDGNGTLETRVTDSDTFPAGQIRVGSSTFLLEFDARVVPLNQKYRFAVQVDSIGPNLHELVLRWRNAVGENVPAELPYGRHRITWSATDSCGTVATCTRDIWVRDAKPPTVVCLNGLSVNLMNINGGEITLWASDFLQYTEDNYSFSSGIKLGIRRVGTGTGFPLNPDGTPQASVTFNCDDLGEIPVELWAKDQSGLSDYCTVTVLIKDDADVCGSQPTGAFGQIISVCDNQLVEDVEIKLDNGLQWFTSVSGIYYLNGPIDSNATLSPCMDLDHLNGVNTWDLVLIKRHILNIEPLDSPFKIIAADANKSGTVTMYDIVELRRLILGTYSKLPYSASWRFLYREQMFQDSLNPFLDSLVETLRVGDILDNTVSGDFCGIKIGDVDCTAIPHNLSGQEERGEQVAAITFTDRSFKAGEEFDLTFQLPHQLMGAQLTLELPDLEISSIEADNPLTTNNFAVHRTGSGTRLTFVHEQSAQGFTLHFRALADGQAAHQIALSDAITRSIGFDATGQRYQLKLAAKATVSTLAPYLLQVAPNPFHDRTSITFHQPKAGPVLLRVYDLQGRLVHELAQDMPAGTSNIALTASDLGSSGLYRFALVANDAVLGGNLVVER